MSRYVVAHDLRVMWMLSGAATRNLTQVSGPDWDPAIQLPRSVTMPELQASSEVQAFLALDGTQLHQLIGFGRLAVWCWPV
jgi:hypothetical protein